MKLLKWLFGSTPDNRDRHDQDAETGRPHWIVLDEVHHCLPAKWDPAPVILPRELPAAIAVTVHPEAVSPDFLALISTVVGVGDGAWQAIDKFCAGPNQTCKNAGSRNRPSAVARHVRTCETPCGLQAQGKAATPRPQVRGR